MSHLPLPISDYVTDTKSVLDNSLRILQAIVDISADAGWADTALSAMKLVQALMQGRWHDDSPAMLLPGVLSSASATSLGSLPALIALANKDRNKATKKLELVVGAQEARAACAALERMPAVELSVAGMTKKSSQSGTSTAGAAGGGESWIVEIGIVRTSGRTYKGAPPRVYAPRFPKIKEEGWWLVAMVPGSNELLALKRVSFGHRTKVTLNVSSVAGPLSAVEVRVVCDSYLGLDQQHVVQLKE